MAAMEKTIMTMVIVVLGMSIITQVAQGMAPAPPSYCCPIPTCDLCFYTYEELYEHFTTAHPSEPIDIIWD